MGVERELIASWMQVECKLNANASWMRELNAQVECELNASWMEVEWELNASWMQVERKLNLHSIEVEVHWT